MKINVLTIGIIIMVVIFGGIGSTFAMDLWSTTSEKTPAKITDGQAAGSYNPADIRGSYTFKEVSELFQIDLKVLYQAFNIPEDTDGTKLKIKDLGTLIDTSDVEIGNPSVQIFVALYRNLPIELTDTYIPKQAAMLITQKNSQLTPEQKNYLDTHTIDVTSKKKADSVISNQVATEESENVVNGSATFQKVLDSGVTKKQIEKVIKADMPATNQSIRDFCIKNGLSFPDIKDQLNALIK